MRDNLYKSTEWILAHEGGFVNHPDDPGGATNYGVTQGTYDAWRSRKGKAKQSVRVIDKDEVIAIYKTQYWDKVMGDNLPNGVDYAMYDFAINSGPTRAIKFIQELVGVEVDGVMGQITLAAIQTTNDIQTLIENLCFRRWEWLKTLRHYNKFGKGWTRRVMGEDIGVQVRDTGVIDRAVKLWKEEPVLTAPKSINDGAGVRTINIPEKRTKIVKESINLDNIIKIGAGSIPAWMGAAATLPEGPMQYAFSTIVVGLFLLTAWYVLKRLA